VHEERRLIGISHIRRERHQAIPGRELVAERIEARLASRCNGDAGTICQERAHDLAADAAGAPGYENTRVLQTEIHR